MPGNTLDSKDTVKMSKMDRICVLKESHSSGEGRQWAQTYKYKDKMIPESDNCYVEDEECIKPAFLSPKESI